MPRAAPALADYRAKRRFGETPEPEGRAAAANGFSFVVQKHAARRLHYDFRLELDGVLKSWAVTRGPSLDPADKRLAVRTEDHPLDYADFEGTIPAGNYGAGSVIVWDRGTWTPEPGTDPNAALDSGKITFRLDGERLRGEWTLVRLTGKRQRTERRENWLLIKGRDAEAGADRDITDTDTTSVLSGRTLEAVASGVPPIPANKPRAKARTAGSGSAAKRGTAAFRPGFVSPALATLVDTVPRGGDWVFEIKFDGYRALAAIEAGACRMFTRSGLDWSDRFRPIADALAGTGWEGALLDGEIVVFDEAGRTDFSALQAALTDDLSRLSYVVFDVLAHDGEDLRPLPLVERKRRLKALLADAPAGLPVHYSEHAREGEALQRQLCGQDFEGVIAKRADGPYRSGRSDGWRKIKCGNRQEFVVVGFSPSDKGRPFASLLLGLNGKDGLRYAGRVGTGFDEAMLVRLADALAPLRVDKPPLPGVPRAIARSARWVRPELVMQIAFAGFTGDGAVRHARFQGLREDKQAVEVADEQVAEEEVTDDLAQEPAMAETRSARPSKSDASAVAGVRLTHPERVLFPEQGVTKRDLALYLEAAAPRMLPFLADRLVSLVRCPEGRRKQCFFQRHGGAGLPDAIRRKRITEKDGDEAEYVYIRDVAGLVSAAQMGVLEFHVWGSTITRLEKPERLVLDLDPDDAVPFAAVREAAFAMRDALDAIGLASFPLITGGKGIHVVAPLKPRHEWPVVKALARALAEHFANGAPDRYVATMSKARRTGRIFIDHFRNERGSTAIAPYSPRAREGAPVAWPVTWEALPEIEGANIVRLDNAMSRLDEPDPWAGYEDARGAITAQALKALGVKV